MCLGVPGEIIAIDEADPMTAIVEVSGVCRRVNLACVLPEGGESDSLVGAWTLVHVGFAMSLIDVEEANKTLAILSELEASMGDSPDGGGNSDAVR